MIDVALRNLPVDHPHNRAYRVGGGLIGAFLLVFGLFGFFDLVGIFSTEGDKVAGLSTNAVLSTLSVVVGGILILGAFVGGNTASTLNGVIGILFLLSGLVNLVLLRSSFNVLNFEMPNVIFSFVVGMALLLFGLYGRVSAR